MKIPEGVNVEPVIFHANYRVGRNVYGTRVRGVPTQIIASRFIGGDSISVLANDYEIPQREVMAALRWELHPRRTRVRAVEKAVRKR